MVSDLEFVFIGCLARLHQLELKRWDKGVFRPLEGDEQDEYEGLQVWWNDIGIDNQLSLLQRIKVSSRAVAKRANAPVAISEIS